MGFKDLLFKPEAREAVREEELESRKTGSAPVSSPPTPPVRPSSYLGGVSRPGVVPAGSSINAPSSNAGVSSVADPEFKSELERQLAQAQTPGYNEFLDQVELLRDVIPDEGMRTQKAVKAIEKMLKIAPGQLLAAVQERLEILDHSKAQFENDIQAEVQQQVVSNNQAVANLDARIVANRNEQQRLELELQQLTTERDSAQRQVAEAQDQANQVRARFKSAYEPFKASLTAAIAKIRSHNQGESA